MKTKRTLLIIGIVVGAVMMLSPFIGLLGTVLGMIKAFNTLGSAGISDPKELAEATRFSLNATALGLLLAVPGIIIFISSIVGLVLLNNRKANPSATS